MFPKYYFLLFGNHLQYLPRKICPSVRRPSVGSLSVHLSSLSLFPIKFFFDWTAAPSIQSHEKSVFMD